MVGGRFYHPPLSSVVSVPLALDALVNATATTVGASVPSLAESQPPAANSSSLSGIIPAIQSFSSGFASNVGVVTLSLDNAAIDIGKAAVVFLIIAGVILWFSRANRRLGRELVQGGVLIGLFIEFVVPALMALHY